jgi:hypothetical protein
MVFSINSAVKTLGNYFSPRIDSPKRTYAKDDYLSTEDMSRLRDKTIKIHNKLQKIKEDIGGLNIEISHNQLKKFARELNFSLNASNNLGDVQKKLQDGLSNADKLSLIDLKQKEDVDEKIENASGSVGNFARNDGYLSPGRFHGYAFSALEGVYTYAKDALAALNSLSQNNKNLHYATRKKLENNIAELNAVIPEIQEFRKDVYASMLGSPYFLKSVDEKSKSDTPLCDYYIKEVSAFKDSALNDRVKQVITNSHFGGCVADARKQLDDSMKKAD